MSGVEDVRKSVEHAGSREEYLAQNSRTGSAGESVKCLLLRVSRKLPTLSYGRVRGIWYRDQRLKISADELIELKRIAKIEDEERHATNEVSALRKRLELLEAKIEALAGKGTETDRVEDS